MSISVEVDTSVNAAYIRFSDNEVAETSEISDAVVVDVDAAGGVVGIEVLDLSAPLELPLIRDRYKMSDSEASLLLRLEPTLANVRARASAPDHGSAVVRSSMEFERLPAFA